MAGNTGVDLAGMRASQPRFESAVADIGNSYNAILDQANALQASWGGDASTAFSGAMNDWLDQCNLIKQQLQTVLEKIEAATHQYDQVHSNTVDSATALKQAVAAGLPGL